MRKSKSKLDGKRVLQGFVVVTLFSLSLNIFAHPGRVDENGGHYNGDSYHCHMTACELPDTFTRGGYRSVFDNPSDRDKFFNPDDWPFDIDFDGDCQTTRTEILVATSTAPVSYTNPRNCEVRTGNWLDEYTGKEFSVAAQLGLDHIIPLKYAHSHGGDAWPQNKRVAFANDPLNLILTDRKEINSKRERGPSRYLPREQYQCDYVRQWQALADKYDLALANADKNRITVVLRTCPQD